MLKGLTVAPKFPGYVRLNRADDDVDTLTFPWPSLRANNMVSPKSRPQALCTLGDQMPQYFFTVRAGEGEDKALRAERRR